MGPKRTRASRSTVWPTASTIRRISRLRPSRNSTRSHAFCFRRRATLTSAGAVTPSSSRTPRRSRSSCASDGMPLSFTS